MAASLTLAAGAARLRAARAIDRLRVPGRRTARRPTRRPRRAARWSRGVQRRPWRGRRRRRWPCCSRSPRRSPACGSASRTAATTRAARPPAQAYDLVAHGVRPGRERPAAARRRARATRRARRASRRSRHGCDACPASPPSARPPSTAAGDAARADRRRRRTSPQDTRDEDLVAPTCATTCCPAPACRSTSAARPPRSIDQSSATAARLPLFIGGVVGLSFLLLLVAFRSVVRGAQGRRDEPAVDRRRLRRRGAASPRAAGPGSCRHRHADAGAAVHPGDHVRRPVRAVDGLRGVPALARPRGVPGAAGDTAQRGRPRALAAHRAGHHAPRR